MKPKAKIVAKIVAKVVANKLLQNCIKDQINRHRLFHFPIQDRLLLQAVHLPNHLLPTLL